MKTNIKMNINVNSPLSLCVVVISSLLLSIQELSATQQSQNDRRQFEVQGVQQEKITLITMKDDKNLFQTMAQIAVGQKQYDNFFPVLFEEEQGWSAEKLINLPKNDISHMQATVLYDYESKDKTKPLGVYISGVIPETVPQPNDQKEEVKEEESNIFWEAPNTTYQVPTESTNNLEFFKQYLSRSIATGLNSIIQLNNKNLEERFKKMKEQNNYIMNMYEQIKHISHHTENVIIQKHTSGNPKDFKLNNFVQDMQQFIAFQIEQLNRIAKQGEEDKKRNIQDRSELMKSYSNDINILFTSFEKKFQRIIELEKIHTDLLHRLAQQKLELQYTKEKNDIDLKARRENKDF